LVLKATIGESVNVEAIFQGIFWFPAVDFVTLAILIGFPGFLTWLPDLVFGRPT
jgi:TRAP-type C4-dicarboxylate transport system permease large subunit